MKLLTRSEIKNIQVKQKNNLINTGIKYASLIDEEIKKLNTLKTEFEKQKIIIENSYKKLFDEKLKELEKLQEKKNNLLKQIKKLESKLK